MKNVKYNNLEKDRKIVHWMQTGQVERVAHNDPSGRQESDAVQTGQILR